MNPFEFKRDNFNLIRLLAATQVVLWHSIEHFKLEVPAVFLDILNCFPDVPIFFVISVLLIFASLERNQNGLVRYFKNRVLRIYPALYICFLVSILSILIFSNINIHVGQMLKWTIAQLTFGQFYNPDFLRPYGVGTLNGGLWTIPVEIEFYAILPLLYFVLNKLKWNKFVLAVLFIGFIGVNQYYVTLHSGPDNIFVKLFGVTIFPYLYMFLSGVILQRNLWIVEKYIYLSKTSHLAYDISSL